jgi:hypothetical protein
MLLLPTRLPVEQPLLLQFLTQLVLTPNILHWVPRALEFSSIAVSSQGRTETQTTVPSYVERQKEFKI